MEYLWRIGERWVEVMEVEPATETTKRRLTLVERVDRRVPEAIALVATLIERWGSVVVERVIQDVEAMEIAGEMRRMPWFCEACKTPTRTVASVMDHDLCPTCWEVFKLKVEAARRDILARLLG